MASHTYIDFPHPITEPQPTIPLPGIEPIVPTDRQPHPATTLPPEANPAQPLADSRDTEAQRGMLVHLFTGRNLIRVRHARRELWRSFWQIVDDVPH